MNMDKYFMIIAIILTAVMVIAVLGDMVYIFWDFIEEIKERKRKK